MTLSKSRASRDGVMNLSLRAKLLIIKTTPAPMSGFPVSGFPPCVSPFGDAPKNKPVPEEAKELQSQSLQCSFASNRAQPCTGHSTSTKREIGLLNAIQQEEELATTTFGLRHKRSPILERLNEVAEPGWQSKQFSSSHTGRHSML